jgi:N-acetylmuramic acid 6-phosphate etherase
MAQPRSDLGDRSLVGSAGLAGLATEAGSDPAADYHARSTVELVELMNAQDLAVPAAVAMAAVSIADAVDAISDRMFRGGRLVYVGAGSSGRIAALDASECESTFSTPSGTVVALIAGGEGAVALEQEAAEDDREAGAADISMLGVGPPDSVIGVSASGRTPYVLGAMSVAADAGALTACIVSVDDSELAQLVEHEIAVVVGAEFLAGSTRLKAGTAQKLVLNTISTISMIRLGKTFGNLMVDVNATNEKLRARVKRIVGTATGAQPKRVDDALAAANGDARVAIVSLLAEIDADEARTRLADAGQSVQRALDG